MSAKVPCALRQVANAVLLCVCTYGCSVSYADARHSTTAPTPVSTYIRCCGCYALCIRTTTYLLCTDTVHLRMHVQVLLCYADSSLPRPPARYIYTVLSDIHTRLLADTLLMHSTRTSATHT